MHRKQKQWIRLATDRRQRDGEATSQTVNSSNPHRPDKHEIELLPTHAIELQIFAHESLVPPPHLCTMGSHTPGGTHDTSD